MEFLGVSTVEAPGRRGLLLRRLLWGLGAAFLSQSDCGQKCFGLENRRELEYYC